MSTAIIVGASRGLGKSIALNLENDTRFSKVICLSRSGTSISTNHKFYHYPIDITNHDSNTYHLRNILKSDNVSLLVNCAGVCFQSPFSSSAFSSVITEVNTNLLGMMFITHTLLKNNYLQKDSHIINISSLMGRVAAPTFASYSATKFAIIGFSEALELELSPDILVSCILPTLIDTEMIKDLNISSNLVYPVNVQFVADEIYKLIFNHSGCKTIGIQATLACAANRISPFVNKFLLRL